MKEVAKMEFYNRSEERTGVQESQMYNSKFDVQCDFIMVYGIDDTLESRIAEFKKRGYIIHLMTGVAWGKYVDYLDGEFDGREHWDEGQKMRDGTDVSHGALTPYMVPTVSFANYLVSKLKRAVDAGVEAIHLEEPEFWVKSGYSEAFKREWGIYYKEPWQDPAESAEAQFRASKLKSHMYARTLDRLSSELKEYAKVKYNRDLRFYVPTHSLINYTHWRIVSPEGALQDIAGVDGYIAQIWTGTSRTKNVYEGILKERTFETAFLEYGVMQELVRGTEKRMWFLHDPIEDNPRYDWENYRKNYFKTVVASLFHPKIYHFEVCPWPNRVMNGKYPRGKDGEPIPADYATNLLTIMHTLRDMKQDKYSFDKESCAVDNSDNATVAKDSVSKTDNIITAKKKNANKTDNTIGILMADSGMFQRQFLDVPQEQTLIDGHPVLNDGQEDELNDIACFNAFYGLSLPLLKQGLSVRPVQLDNIRRFPNYLKNYNTLVLSYEFMKPEYPDIHNALAGWVNDGGTLIYVGDGSDPFHDIRHWWTENGYKNPAQHLFECCGCGKKLKNGLHEFGKGWLGHMNIAPRDIALDKNITNKYRDFVEEALNTRGIVWNKKSDIILRRGKYVITAVMDEYDEDKKYVLKGTYFNLFTPMIDIEENPELKTGSVGLYIDVDKIKKTNKSEIIAISSRVDDFKETKKTLRFTATGPENVMVSARIYMKNAPLKVKAVLNGNPMEITCDYDKKTSTVLLRFWNSPDSVQITISF